MGSPACEGLTIILHGTTKEGEECVWAKTRRPSQVLGLWLCCLPAGPGCFQHTRWRRQNPTAVTVPVHNGLLRISIYPMCPPALHWPSVSCNSWSLSGRLLKVSEPHLYNRVVVRIRVMTSSTLLSIWSGRRCLNCPL